MDSFNQNDWSQPVDPQGAGGYYAAPTARPPGSEMPLEDIQLRNDNAPIDPTAGVFQEAWEHVKENPVETLVLSVLTLMFNSGGGNFNFPSGLGGDSGSDYDSYDSTYDSYDSYDSLDYGSWFDGSGLLGQAGSDFLGGLGGMNPLAGAMSGAEVAMIGVVVMVVFMVLIVMSVLGTFVQFGGGSLWLRLLRGQESTLGASFRGAGGFFLMLFFSGILKNLALFGGFLACIIPGVILTYGFMFVHFMVMDKNIGYVDALKASWRLTDGYKVQLFIFSLLAALLNFAGLLACCVGVFVTNAVTMGALAIIYNRLAAPGNAYLGDSENVSNVFE